MNGLIGRLAASAANLVNLGSIAEHLVPAASALYDIGQNATRWRTIYTTNVFLSGVVELQGTSEYRWSGRSRVYSPADGVIDNATWGLTRRNYWAQCAGSPEYVVAAPVGSYACDTTNGRLYIKRGGGSGSNGWACITPGVKSITLSDSPYSLEDWVGVLKVDATSGVVTVTTSAVNGLFDGRLLHIRETSGANAVSVTVFAGETYDGAAPGTVAAGGHKTTVRDQSSGWYLL